MEEIAELEEYIKSATKHELPCEYEKYRLAELKAEKGLPIDEITVLGISASLLFP